MGRILEYVVLLSSLSLVLGGQQFKEPGNNYEREKQENLTHVIRQYYPKGQNEFFSKRVLPVDYHLRRRLQTSGPKPMRRYPGLQAFAVEESQRKNQKLPRRNIPPFSQTLYPRKNSKNFASVDFHGEIPSQKLSRLYSSNSQNRRPEDFNKRYHKDGRNARYHPRHSPKICDPCNSVPWVPMLNVPDSYRKQRTHVTELHPTPQQNFNFDYHGYSSNTHDVLLPPVPLVPPLEPVYEGTISSSFGLPIGNIPTSHGLLAPISPLATKFAPTVDYGSSFNYFSPHGLLETNPFPELSQVPIVPIHDSGQFYQFDSAIPDLVPPPVKPVDVSNVVLTISEENSANLKPPKPNYHNHKPANDLNSASTAVDSQASHSQGAGKNQNTNFGKLEVVKSIPLAEFTSSVNSPHQQDLPLYPPLDSKKEYHTEKSVTQHSTSGFDFLVPPAKTDANFNFHSNSSGSSSHSKPHDKSEPQGESSAPKPLTSPSLSWLFSDHTAPPADSKSTASALSFAAETQEIASVVNNELRPVSPHPFPVSAPSDQNVGNTKSKKIQIIIPYTTKNKNGHDNNALESVQHEVFQPPVSKSTSENNSVRDFATPALPQSTHPSEINQNRKVVDGFEKENQDEDGKRISEMHHIIASNIRELLREEIEKAQNDQNYPLQNNIDNWTALEYSNHKTVEPKAPKEILTQALAVTSIPGTSISHLLLPSKKIPKEYFKTTPIPVYDEPNTSSFKSTNATVNSSPFTAKPYATTNVYNPIRGNESTKENVPPLIQINHETNYTEVGRERVNHWGRLNENLVLPEARSRTRRVEETTTSSWTSIRYVSSGSEKVQIVTPVSTQRNYTTTSFRRTTRHIHKTETPTTEIPNINRTRFLNRFNSTKLEKVSNQTSPFRKYSFTSTVSVKTTAQNVSVAKTETSKNSSVIAEESVKTNLTVSLKNQTSEDLRFTNKNEHLKSINDIIPFRNKELPWESNQNSSQNVLQFGRQRKSLIKQVNLPKSKSAVSTS